MKRGYQRPWAEILDNARDPDLDSLRLDVEPDDRFGAPLPNRFKSRLRRLPGCLLATGMIWMAIEQPGTGARPGSRLRSLALTQLSRVPAKLPSGQIESGEPLMRGCRRLPPSLSPPIAPIEQATTSTQDEKTSSGAGELFDRLDRDSLCRNARARRGRPGQEPQEGARQLRRSQSRPAKRSSDEIERERPEERRLCRKDGTRQDPGRCLVRLAAEAIATASAVRSPLRCGCAQGCRRYIVTVTKERWSSTTAAMEKCGDAVLSAG